MIRSFKIALLGLMAFFMAGCFSVKYDARGGVTIDPHISSFSVELFQNRAQLVEPSFSQTFTDELKAYIENNTSLRLVTGMGDVSFSGVIKIYKITPQAISANEESAMTRFTIGVEFDYTDKKYAENNFSKTVSGYREFESSEPFSNVEDELSGEIMDELIEQIFNAAFVNW